MEGKYYIVVQLHLINPGTDAGFPQIYASVRGIKVESGTEPVSFKYFLQINNNIIEWFVAYLHLFECICWQEVSYCSDKAL